MKQIVVLCFACVLLSNNVLTQAPPNNNRAQTISNIFQIPIQTLTAISTFAQNTRPLGEIIQRRRNPQFQTVQQRPPPRPQSQPFPVNNYYRSRAARIAGLYTAADGSGFRI